MSSPEKKRKKPPPPQSTQNPSLHHDLILTCLARASRLYYPTFSFVSKSFRSLVASPELYEIRSTLGHTESCLYVCLWFYPDINSRWYTLYRKPDQTQSNDAIKKTKKKNKSSGYVLARVPVPDSLPAQSFGIVAVGSNVYKINGSIYAPPIPTISFLDCRCHTWREAPNMRVRRDCPAANVLDGKIYVAGGSEEGNSLNWMEVFDPKTQTWEPVLNPFADRCERNIFKSAVIEGKICIFGSKGVAYEPKEDRWEAIEEMSHLDLGWVRSSYCVIQNILFCYSSSLRICWYDSEARSWIRLMGLKGLPTFAGYSTVKLADYGGKIAVFWDKYLPSSRYRSKVIWCAVIEIERRKVQEIWGMVEWHDAMLTVPKCYDFKGALSATI